MWHDYWKRILVTVKDKLARRSHHVTNKLLIIKSRVIICMYSNVSVKTEHIDSALTEVQESTSYSY